MAEPLDIVDSLSSSLDDLEATLEPLLAQTLAQTEENLEPEQTAKLQVLLSYVIQDLVLVYLKTKGLDPQQHPVSEELRRVKSYFDKIKEAENPATRSLVVDRAAANRFIRAAISDAQASTAETERLGTSSAAAPAAGTHIRWDNSKPGPSSGDANAPPNRNDDDSSSEEEDLKVFDAAAADSKAGQGSALPPTNPKRRRMDPFQGYSETASSEANAPNDHKKRKKAKGPAPSS
ncbi:hypothetical protein DL93DRAFT_2070848 [Clavulina sp. PMI_390]|nr:hypothetical protein DL93DRAFT_2070848 [Clavulina sp. PMI_390]